MVTSDTSQLHPPRPAVVSRANFHSANRLRFPRFAVKIETYPTICRTLISTRDSLGPLLLVLRRIPFRGRFLPEYLSHLSLSLSLSLSVCILRRRGRRPGSQNLSSVERETFPPEVLSASTACTASVRCTGDDAGRVVSK